MGMTDSSDAEYDHVMVGITTSLHDIIAALASAAVLKTTTQGIQKLEGMMSKTKNSQCKENIHITRPFSSYTFVRMEHNPLCPFDGAHHAGKR